MKQIIFIMYDNQAIQDEFMGLVGLRQVDHPDFDTLSANLVKSSNNVLIQHPLLNIENLDMCARNYGKFYEEWNDTTEYAEGDRVNDGDGNNYESVQDSNTNHALTDTDWWTPVSLLSLYLEDVFRSGIDDVMNKFVNEKKLRRETKTLFDNVVLFEGAGSKNDLIINEGDLVGFAFQLKYARNLVAFIKRIGHQFTQAGELKLWIYHSSQQEVIATATITRTKVNSFEWTNGIDDDDLQIKFRNIDATYDSNGMFFVMYDQNLAPGQAINKTRTGGWALKPCGSCSSFNLRMWNSYSRYATVLAVRVKAAHRVLPEGSNDGGPDLMWDINLMEYPATNFGLNFEFMIRCDLTDLLIQHKDVFAFAIRDQITVRLLEGLRNSTRQNEAETKAGAKAAIALTGRIAGGEGLQEQLEKQIKAIDFEFSGFSDYCLPCNNANGIKYGAGGLQY